MRRNEQKRCVLIPVLIAVIAWNATGAATAAPNGPRDHAGGFFLRLSAGGGTAKTSIEEAGSELEVSGTSADLNLAIGAVVAPNLAVHGTIFGWVLSDPDVELDGMSGTADGDVDMSAFGAGLTYYFMPVNLYLSGSVGAGSLSASGDIDGETDTGIAVDLTAGKEWWVGNGWGLGAAAAFQYQSFPDGEVDANWSGPAFALRFSATMN
ncbi:MAG: hypothetical protein ACT4PE_09285 [Candidatus Eiseniibacteriota bacterium]